MNSDYSLFATLTAPPIPTPTFYTKDLTSLHLLAPWSFVSSRVKPRQGWKESARWTEKEKSVVLLTLSLPVGLEGWRWLHTPLKACHATVHRVAKSQTWLRDWTELNWRPPLFSFASIVAQLVKNPPAMRETWVQSLGWEDPLEKGKIPHSSILA